MTFMANKKQKLIKANGKAICDFRTTLGLKQKDIVSEAKKFNITISLRNYQRAEASEKLSQANLNSIAIFFDMAFNSQGHFANINLSDVVIFDKDYSNKNFPISVIKNENDFQKESCFLYKVSSYNQLSDVVKKSKLRKIFYQFSPNEDEKIVIKEVLLTINRIQKNKYPKVTNHSTSFYSDTDLELELKLLDEMSHANNFITKLNERRIILYAGNFELKYITEKLVSDDAARKEDVGDPSGLHDFGNWESALDKNNYAIFTFLKKSENELENISESISFDYRNRWYEAKLNSLISKPYNTDFVGIDYEAESHFHSHYRHHFDYYWDLDTQRVNFSQIDFKALSEDERKIIYDEVKEEEEASVLAEILSDEKRGK